MLKTPISNYSWETEVSTTDTQVWLPSTKVSRTTFKPLMYVF